MRILIIEDNQEWQGLVKDVLNILPCEIEVASNYNQAQSALQQRVFDVITLDMDLNDAQGLVGWPLLRMLERGKYPQSKNARVIVLSGSGDFQKSPNQVSELLTKHKNVAHFLWKADHEWDDKLYEAVAEIQAEYQSDSVLPGPDTANLRRILADYFKESELRNIAFDLGVDHEKLSGSGKDDLARGLIEHLLRRGRLPELIEMLREQRPDLDLEI